MRHTFKIAAAAALALGGIVLSAPMASAIPLSAVAPSLAPDAGAAAGVEQARWVCGPFRCFWRPNYYGYGGYGGPRPFFGGYGWHGGYGGWHGGYGWRRWHRW